MTRDELKEQIDKLMREYADEEIVVLHTPQRMKELTQQLRRKSMIDEKGGANYADVSIL